MTEATANRAVLCDDDDVLRGVVRRMMEDAGYLVVAEASDADRAVEAVTGSGADVVVLDLALRAGRGEDVIRRLAASPHPPRIVVFSSYVGSSDDLLHDGVSLVVEKPDFDRLDRAIRKLRVTDIEPERRRPSRAAAARTVPPAPAAVTPGGFEPWQLFRGAVDGLSAGDSILALDVVADPAHRELWDHVHRFDLRHTLGRSAVPGRRPGERVSLSPEGRVVIAVVGGHPEAPTAVFGRIEHGWADAGLPGIVVGAFGHVGERSPMQLLGLALEALGGEADPHHPLRVV